MRRLAPVLLALAAALGALLPSPARAQAGSSYPSGYISGNHGRAVYTVYHPSNRNCFVEVAVDVHFGYNTASPDPDAEFASPVGRITQGNCVARIEHQGTHLGYESGQPVVRDHNPISGQPRNRQNGLGPRDYINTSANQVLASQDWRRLRCVDDRVAARFFFGIRFDDGVGVNTSRRSNYVEHDLNGCNVDLRVQKLATEGTTTKTSYRPGDTFVYQLDVTNPSADPAPATTVVDTLPVGIEVLSLEPGCAFVAATRQVTCVIGELRARAVAIRVIEVRALATASGTLVNTATASTSANDPSLGNNTTQHELTLAPPPTTSTSTTSTTLDDGRPTTTLDDGRE